MAVCMCLQSCHLPAVASTTFRPCFTRSALACWVTYEKLIEADIKPRFGFVSVGLSCINHNPHAQVIRTCCGSCPFALTSSPPSYFIRSDLITVPSGEGHMWHKEILKQCFWSKYADALKTCISVKDCYIFQSEFALRGDHILTVIKKIMLHILHYKVMRDITENLLLSDWAQVTNLSPSLILPFWFLFTPSPGQQIG